MQLGSHIATIGQMADQGGRLGGGVAESHRLQAGQGGWQRRVFRLQRHPAPAGIGHHVVEKPSGIAGRFRRGQKADFAARSHQRVLGQYPVQTMADIGCLRWIPGRILVRHRRPIALHQR